MLRGITEPLSSLGGSSRLGLFLAMVLAVITGALIFIALGQVKSEPAVVPGTGQTLSIVTATESVPAGTQITAGMLAITLISADAVLTGALADPSEVIGRFTRIPILAGEQMLSSKIVNSAVEGEGLPFVIPVGMRAMAISVNKIVAAGGLIRPGDRVDIFAIQDIRETNPITRDVDRVGTRSVIIAQNIEVLAIEQEILRVLPTEGNIERDPTTTGTLLDQADADPSGTVATLALTPGDAANILVALQDGEIRLAVRAAGDTAIVSADDGAKLESSTLLPVDEARNITFLVPAGMRAMAINVDKVIGVGGLLRPNDLVDIIAVFNAENSNGDLVAARATTMAQAIKVLAVEQALENVGGEALAVNGPADQPAAQPGATVVTLAVTPELAQQILLAAEHGQVRLSARAPGDTEIVEISDTILFAQGTTADAAADEAGVADLRPEENDG